jgi:imidazolonepropionase-like amidohydrolase
MPAYLFRNVDIWDGVGDERYPGEALVIGNRITKVARGQGQISSESAGEIIDGSGMTLMPGLVEGHCHLSFVGPLRNQDLGEIPPEEHLLRTCRNATFILDHGFTSATRQRPPSCVSTWSCARKSKTAISLDRAIAPPGRKSR